MTTEPITIAKAKAFITEAANKLRSSKLVGTKYFDATKLALVINSVKVDINSRYRTKAGQAEWRFFPTPTFTIRLSEYVLNRASLQDQYNVVAHELAHLYQAALLGKSGHDKVFKMIDKAMGGIGKRCHTIVNTRKNRVFRHIYTDILKPGSSLNFTTRTHNIIQGNKTLSKRYILIKANVRI